MDTGVEHGHQPDGGAAQASPDGGGRPGRKRAGREVATPVRQPPMPVYEDAPTTILDLRAVFAEAAPDAPPLGVVTVEREHPVRAALAFMGVLGLIAVAAGGAVVGTAAAGKAIYAKVSGPATCSAAQVAAGAALEQWLLDAARQAAGNGAKVDRTGCTTEGIVDPLEGQAVATTVAAGKPTAKVVAALKSRDCTFGQASPSGVRSCTVTIADNLAALELRPAKDKKTTTFTVTYR
jgi:hypothetical protein